MRKLVLLPAFLLACGGSSSGGGSNPLTGTVGGRVFAPAEVKAIRAGTGTAPCSLTLPGAPAPVSIGISAFAIQVTSFPNICADYATSQCKAHANSQQVIVIFALLDPTGAEPALSPGTFTVYPDFSTVVPDGKGHLVVAFADALATGAAPTCTGTPSPAASGGTLRLDEVSGPIKGHVSLTFQDGSTLSGDFSADLCPSVSLDVCNLAQTQAICTGTPTCI